MKLIPYDTKSELDLYDAARMQGYKTKVSNANLTQFSQKIEHNGVWCAVLNSKYMEYFNQDELSRVFIVQGIS